MIVSTTLAGGGRESTIGEAIRSVANYVDQCLILDTGVTDKAIDVAVQAAGPKSRVRKVSPFSTCAKARNDALNAAERVGATWAITVDSDEVFSWEVSPEGFRKYLYAVDTPIVVLHHEDHSKPQIIRIPPPIPDFWYGPAHETVYATNGTVFDFVHVMDVPKSQEHLKRQALLNAESLATYVLSHPAPRWWMLLGEQYIALNKFPAALHAFQNALEQGATGESAMWALFRMAAMDFSRQDYRSAIECCLTAITHFAASVEVYDLLGQIYLAKSEYSQAVRFANLALQCKTETRVGLRDTRCNTQPFVTLYRAFRAQGKNAEYVFRAYRDLTGRDIES